MTYTLIRIPLKDLSSCDFNMNVTGDEEAARQYIVSTEDSIIIDQLARLRGYPCSHITEMILIRSRNKNSGEVGGSICAPYADISICTEDIRQASDIVTGW